MCCTKLFCQIKIITNQNLQLLCYVISFDILHHCGVIAASQICSVSRKYCAVLRNRFFFLGGGVGVGGGNVCLFVDTIPLERLNQSEPNFSHMTFDWNSLAKFKDGRFISLFLMNWNKLSNILHVFLIVMTMQQTLLTYSLHLTLRTILTLSPLLWDPLTIVLFQLLQLLLHHHLSLPLSVIYGTLRTPGVLI